MLHFCIPAGSQEPYAPRRHSPAVVVAQRVQPPACRLLPSLTLYVSILRSPAEILYALTVIPGVGRRISNIVCKKAEVNMHKRAGEMTPDEIERVVAILQNPRQFKIPDWMLNRQKDRVDGKSYQLVSNAIAVKLRDDVETLKKIRAHRGLRHYWALKVRGQHTCSTGRGRSHAIAAAQSGK